MVINHQNNMGKKKPGGMGKFLGSDSALQALNTKLLVTNFPNTHTKDMITKICEVFGRVKCVDLLKDPSTGEFKG